MSYSSSSLVLEWSYPISCLFLRISVNFYGLKMEKIWCRTDVKRAQTVALRKTASSQSQIPKALGFVVSSVQTAIKNGQRGCLCQLEKTGRLAIAQRTIA